MPVKLIGPRVNFVGKTLWEICGNLKNFGVGRLVIKSHFQNYPEISYYKIVKVQPVTPPSDKYKNRSVMVWAEHVFRGNRYKELVQLHNQTHMSKFQLIPRSEEDKFLSTSLTKKPNEVPAYREFPPLLKVFLEREAALQGKSVRPMRTVVEENLNAFSSINDDKSILTDNPPDLWVAPVEELKKTLERLKENKGDTTLST